MENKTVAVAIYLEFKSASNATAQIIVTPECSNETTTTNPVFIRRIITPNQKRVNWTITQIRKPKSQSPAEVLAAITGTTLADTEKERVAKQSSELQFYNNLSEYLNHLVRSSYFYKLTQPPIYVEITQEDTHYLQKCQMPPKMWTRIKTSRQALVKN